MKAGEMKRWFIGMSMGIVSGGTSGIFLSNWQLGLAAIVILAFLGYQIGGLMDFLEQINNNICSIYEADMNARRNERKF